MEELEIEDVFHGTIVGVCTDKSNKKDYGVSIMADGPHILFKEAYDDVDYSKYSVGQRIVWIFFLSGESTMMDEDEFNKKIEETKKNGGRKV